MGGRCLAASLEWVIATSARVAPFPREIVFRKARETFKHSHCSNPRSPRPGAFIASFRDSMPP